MKVEIAEHLIGRWLRHVVGCRLVEPFLPPGQKLAQARNPARNPAGNPMEPHRLLRRF